MKSKLKSKQTEMRILCGTILAAAAAVAVTANAGTIFEAKGLVTDKTPGFRFGNVTFTDNDRVAAKFEQIEMTEGAKGRLTTKKLRLPHKEPGKGAYFKFSFDAKYEFMPCYTWLYGSGLPNQYYSRDFVHSGELGKQIIGRVMLAYFLTGGEK